MKRITLSMLVASMFFGVQFNSYAGKPIATNKMNSSGSSGQVRTMNSQSQSGLRSIQQTGNNGSLKSPVKVQGQGAMTTQNFKNNPSQKVLTPKITQSNTNLNRSLGFSGKFQLPASSNPLNNHHASDAMLDQAYLKPINLPGTKPGTSTKPNFPDIKVPNKYPKLPGVIPPKNPGNNGGNNPPHNHDDHCHDHHPHFPRPWLPPLGGCFPGYVPVCSTPGFCPVPVVESNVLVTQPVSASLLETQVASDIMQVKNGADVALVVEANGEKTMYAVLVIGEATFACEILRKDARAVTISLPTVIMTQNTMIADLYLMIDQETLVNVTRFEIIK